MQSRTEKGSLISDRDGIHDPFNLIVYRMPRNQRIKGGMIRDHAVLRISVECVEEGWVKEKRVDSIVLDLFILFVHV